MERQLELKGADGTALAKLAVTSDGRASLTHALTLEQLKMRIKVWPFDESGTCLSIQEGAHEILVGGGGTEPGHLRVEESGLLVVRDSSGLAGLRLADSAPGALQGDRTQPGGPGLELGPFGKIFVYRERLARLYGEVRKWLEKTPLQVREHTIDLSESAYGSYQAPALEITDGQGRRVATLQPVGVGVIGAEGRVDLIGSRDRQTVLYLEAGGPQVKAPGSPRGLFRGVDGAGWYWLEDARLGRVRQLDQTLFGDFLFETADYDA